MRPQRYCAMKNSNALWCCCCYCLLLLLNFVIDVKLIVVFQITHGCAVTADSSGPASWERASWALSSASSLASSARRARSHSRMTAGGPRRARPTMCYYLSYWFACVVQSHHLRRMLGNSNLNCSGGRHRELGDSWAAD